MQTRRLGADISARYQFISWLYGDLDLNYTKARTIADAKGENYVPLAPSFTIIGGLSAKMKNGFTVARFVIVLWMSVRLMSLIV